MVNIRESCLNLSAHTLHATWNLQLKSPDDIQLLWLSLSTDNL